MAIDVDKIDAQIRRLQEIRRLAADPEALALLEQLVTPNGTKERGEVVDASNDAGEKGHLFDDLVGESKRGDQIRAIRIAISSCGGDTFDVAAIGQKVRESGVEITNIAVGKVLQRLEKRHEIKVVKRGVGSVPNVYSAA